MGVGSVCKLNVHNGNMINNRARNRGDQEENCSDEEKEGPDMMEETGFGHVDGR
jgi:hypothetical protein